MNTERSFMVWKTEKVVTTQGLAELNEGEDPIEIRRVQAPPLPILQVIQALVVAHRIMPLVQICQRGNESQTMLKASVADQAPLVRVRQGERESHLVLKMSY